MLGIGDYGAFCAAILLFLALPGPGTFALLTSTAKGGFRAGAAATLGVILGDQVLLWAAVAGVAALLAAYPAVFQAVQYAGAAYLAWIGLSLLRGAAALGEVPVSDPRRAGTRFRHGLLTCLLNPKAYLFMAAVYPQFARPEHGSMTAQAWWMGTIIACTQVAVYGALVLGAGRAGALLRESKSAQVRVCQAMGLALMLGAVGMVWQGWAG